MSGKRCILAAQLFAVLAMLGLVTMPPSPAEATDGSVRFTAAGDYGSSSTTTTVLNGIGAAAPDFHLALGDLSYGAAGDEPSWCNLVTTHVGAALPFELIAGNHESNGLNGLIDNFAQCLPNRLSGLVGSYGKQWYVDVPAAAPVMRIVMISPNLIFPDGRWNYTVGSAHYNWTAAAIDGARAAGIPWVVVGMHEPCLTMTAANCSSGPDLLNLLVTKKVDLVLAGHVHMYERTKQLGLSASCSRITPNTSSPGCIRDSDSTMTQGGTVFATVGTGGETEQHPTLTDPEAPYFAAYNGVHTSAWGFLDVSADANQLSASFDTTSGTTLNDSFTISGSQSPPPPPPPTTVGFVGADQFAAGAVRTEQVTVPAATAAGDTLVLMFAGSPDWSAPSGVSGWRSLGTFTTGTTTSSVWVKAADSGDAGQTIRMTNIKYTKGVLALGVYHGVDPPAVTASYVSDTYQSSHAGPVVTAPGDAWMLSWWADKSASTTSWTAPADVTTRDVVAGTGGGHYSALLTDTGSVAPAGPYGPLIAVADSTASKSVAWTVTLPAQ